MRIWTDLEERIAWLETRVGQLEQQSRDKPWYKQIGIWFAVVLTIGMLYMIYCLWMVESGYELFLPW